MLFPFFCPRGFFFKSFDTELRYISLILQRNDFNEDAKLKIIIRLGKFPFLKSQNGNTTDYQSWTAPIQMFYAFRAYFFRICSVQNWVKKIALIRS